jgi:hypothetical protein
VLRKFLGDDGIEWAARFKGTFTQVPASGGSKTWVMYFKRADNSEDVWLQGTIIAEGMDLDGLSEADLRKSLKSATS